MSATTDLQLDVYTKFKNNKYAKEATLKKYTYASYDPTDPMATPTDVDSTVYLVFGIIEDSKVLTHDTVLRTGDKFAYYAGNGVIPVTDDVIVVGGDTKKIKQSADAAVDQGALFEIILGT